MNEGIDCVLQQLPNEVMTKAVGDCVFYSKAL